MKKMILTAVLILSVGIANAQLSWTARVGANVSGITNTKTQMKIGWKAGAGIDYSFNKLFSLRPMIYYTTKGSSEGRSTMGFSPNKTVKLGYLEMPIFASFHFPLGKTTSLIANIGPYFSYLTNKVYDYKKFDSGVSCELDFEVRRFIIGVEAQYGLTPLTENADLHNINYSLMFGYRF